MSSKKVTNRAIASRLVELRRKIGLSRDEFARRLDVTDKYLYMIESGRKHPTRRLLSLIGLHFGVSVDFLLTGVDHGGTIAEPARGYGLPAELQTVAAHWATMTSEEQAALRRCATLLDGDADMRTHLIGQLKILEETARQRKAARDRAAPRPQKRTAGS